MSAIVVSDLVKVYKGTDNKEIRAVDGVTFEVANGEVFGLLGPNGAGKTTTLEILEGLRRPTAGSAEILGVPVGKGSGADRRKLKTLIGVQLQESSYFDELSLIETLRLLASFYPDAKNPDELLESVGLSEKRNSKFRDLSGGQAHRFSIAAALVNDPRVLFLDEPTTGLDPQARRNLWDLIEDIKSSGKRTIVLTTHYMEEAELLCDRVGIIDRGKLVALDSPRNLIATLGGSYAASLVVACNDKESVSSRLDSSLLKSITEEGRTEDGLSVLRVELVSGDPRGIFHSVDRLVEAGAHIMDISVRNASLEDVFLQLTGRALRD